ncbi:MAG: FAD-dependent oxidoreductase, partial [Paracoccaceae bacterium]
AGLPRRTRPGAPAVDAPFDGGWLLDRLGGDFALLAIGTEIPARIEEAGIALRPLRVQDGAGDHGELLQRYLGDAPAAVYLIRPDQRVAARWTSYDETEIRRSLRVATGRT